MLKPLIDRTPEVEPEGVIDCSALTFESEVCENKNYCFPALALKVVLLAPAGCVHCYSSELWPCFQKNLTEISATSAVSKARLHTGASSHADFTLKLPLQLLVRV